MTEDKDFIPINADQFIPIKATPKNMMPLMNKMIQDRINKEEAQKRTQQNPPKFKTEADYYKCQSQQKTRLSNGAIVVGNVTEEEKQALNTDSDVAFRRIATMRQKALEIMQKARIENRSLGNYFKQFRGE